MAIRMATLQKVIPDEQNELYVYFPLYFIIRFTAFMSADDK